MSDETTDVIVAGTVIKIPPELATALVAAQVAVGPVIKAGKNSQLGSGYSYATSEDIGAVAKDALNGAGAAFVRLGTQLTPPALDDYNMGNQGYAGDVHERWMIVHSSGSAIVGTSTMPVVVSKGRPHDKGVSASLTYSAGVTWRGLLGIERADKHEIDARQDAQDSKPIERKRPTCTGKAQPIADSNRALVAELVKLFHDPPSKIWHAAMRKAGIEGGPDDVSLLTPDDGRRVKVTLEAWAAKARVDAKVDDDQRQPGDGT